MNENRKIWVDYAKAVGIILVVYGHVARGVFNAGIPFSEPVFRIVDSVVYTFHMPLFFFLSGLFLIRSLEKRGSHGLLENKVSTIVYPFILWSLIQGFTEVFLSDYTNGQVAYSNVFSMLWAPRAHFWFLYALFLITVVSTTVLSLLPRKAGMALLFTSAVGYVFQEDLSNHFLTGYINKYLVFFVFGVLFSQSAIRFELGSTRMLIIWASLFAGCQTFFHAVLGLNFEDTGFASLVLALVSIVFVVSFSCRLAEKRHEWLLLLGASSMGIYLMHVLAGSGARMILAQVLHIDSLAVHLLAGCTVGLVAPLLVVQWVSRYRIPYVFSATGSKAPGRSQRNPIQSASSQA